MGKLDLEMRGEEVKSQHEYKINRKWRIVG